MRRLINSVTSTLLACGLLLSSVAVAADPTFTKAAEAGPDFAVQGEYEGKVGGDGKFAAQVIAEGDGKFTAVLFNNGLPGAGGERTKIALKGVTKDASIDFTGEGAKGAIQSDKFRGTLEEGTEKRDFELKKVERKSPTLGMKPPAEAIVLFDGSNTKEWVDGKLMEEKYLGVGTRTVRKFKNYTLHLEFRSPFMPFSKGQARGNSGMYLNDQYEFQILDSFGLSGENNECGGYYSFTKPAVNMCLPPLSWQTYDVEFRIAEFADGKKVKPAVATVKLNGVAVHDKYEIPRFNGGGGQMDESQPGSIFVQDHGNPVYFQNIWIVQHD